MHDLLAETELGIDEMHRQVVSTMLLVQYVQLACRLRHSQHAHKTSQHAQNLPCSLADVLMQHMHVHGCFLSCTAVTSNKSNCRISHRCALCYVGQL
jgi:hypothetical protein